MKCDFYERVKNEEGSTNFLNSWQKLRKLPQSDRQGDPAAVVTAGVRQLQDQQWVTETSPDDRAQAS